VKTELGTFLGDPIYEGDGDDSLMLEEEDHYDFQRDLQAISIVNCKLDCIDEGHNYCPTANKLSGTCCNSTSACTRTSICSNDVTDANFKMWACNNPSTCHSGSSMTITPVLGGTAITLTQAGDVVRGQTCNFLIKFPTTAKTGDEIYFRANLKDRCTIYYTIAPGYNNNIIAKGTCAKSKINKISYP